MFTIPEKAPPGREWVDDIKDCRQRALALAIPFICRVSGLTPEDLSRGHGNSPHGIAKSGMVTVTLGAIIQIGREMALPWSDLQGPQSLGSRMVGVTEIRDLAQGHRWTHSRASSRAEEFVKLGVVGRAFALEIDKIRDATFALWQKWHLEEVAKKKAEEAKARAEAKARKAHQAMLSTSDRNELQDSASALVNTIEGP